GVRGHAVPRLRREFRSGGRDDLVDPFGHDPIRLRHLGDLLPNGLLASRLAASALALRLDLGGTLLHGRPFLGAEALTLLPRRGLRSGLGGLGCLLLGHCRSSPSYPLPRAALGLYLLLYTRNRRTTG